jgi:hypothetical protein
MPNPNDWMKIGEPGSKRVRSWSGTSSPCKSLGPRPTSTAIKWLSTLVRDRVQLGTAYGCLSADELTANGLSILVRQMRGVRKKQTF